MNVSTQPGPGGDEYYHDYMMVLEVFDKMDPAEQAAQNASVSTTLETQQQQSEIQPSTLNGAFDNSGGFPTDGLYAGGMPGLPGFLGAQDTTSTGRVKRDRSQGGSGLDMDGHALASMSPVGYGAYPGNSEAPQGQYLDPVTGMGMNAHLMPSQPAAGAPAAGVSASSAGSTGTKKRGASTVDDLLSHVAMAKQRRRERNKVLARKTRIKKKVELEQLKSQIDHLTNENSRLRSLVAEAGIEYQEDKANLLGESDELDGMMQEIANDSSIFSTVTSTSITATADLPQYPPLPNYQGGTMGEIISKTDSCSVTSNKDSGVVDLKSESGSHSEVGKSMDEDKESGTNSGNGNSDSDGDGKTSEERQDASDDKGSSDASAPTDKASLPAGRATRTSSRRVGGSKNRADTSPSASRANSRRTRTTRDTTQGEPSASSLEDTGATNNGQKIISEILDADNVDVMTLVESFKTSASHSVASDDASDDAEDHIIRCCVVEDSLVQAKLMCKHLLSLSSDERIMKVYRCASGEGAIDFLEKKGGHNCDLWFIDQNLGTKEGLMKGSDVIAKIRGRPENASITIVGVTTNPLAHFVEMNAAGVDMVWGKEDINGKGMTNKISRLIAPKAPNGGKN